MGSIPCQGTKIPHAAWHGQENNKNFLKDLKKKKKKNPLAMQEMQDTQVLSLVWEDTLK